jgi:ornithine carbamoyltransferase
MKHFITLADLSAEEFWGLLNEAARLKEEWKAGGNSPLLKGKTLGMLFQKPSLRTRVSFEVGVLQLGGHALYLSPNEVQLGKRESTPDVARVLAGYVDCIMARVFAHKDVATLAAYSRVPVINGLSDFLHPCQALADMFTLYEHWHGEMRGRKLAYVGDGNNVCHSLLFAAVHAGLDITVATPPGYEPDRHVVTAAQEMPSNSSVTVTNDPREAVSGAHAVYTDVWASMGQESEQATRQQVFPPYQVNDDLLRCASPDAVVLHCLPAHRGEEITDQVMDGPQSLVFVQAENRLHAQKALLVALMA